MRVATPPSQAEIDREVAEFDVVFANLVEQRRIQAGSELADDVVGAVDIREAIAAPETILEVFRGMQRPLHARRRSTSTPRRLFAGAVVRALLLTPEAGEADAAALRHGDARPGRRHRRRARLGRSDRLRRPAADRRAARRRSCASRSACSSAATSRSSTSPTACARCSGRPTNEPGRATVRVRFGSGLQGFAPDEAAYVQLGQPALVSSGIGPLGQNELDRLATGRKFGFDFRIEEGTFVFEALTRADDVADQLYLFAAKLAHAALGRGAGRARQGERCCSPTTATAAIPTA